MPHPYDSSKPTLVLCNSPGTSADLYRHQYENKDLNKLANLLAIELLGHGQTRAKTENSTYWASVVMNLQVLDTLNIKGKVFVLGTSQGTPSFKPANEFYHFMNFTGFGKDIPTEDGKFWVKAIQKNWDGDDGRRRARMCAINLRNRDGLHSRLFDVGIPVLWLHGDQDVVYSVANAQEEIKLFVNSPDATLQVIEGGPHYLNYTKAKEVDAALTKFLSKYIKQAKL
ncbi:alpha/beta hydrolase fold family protein [Aureobasidium subglaciale]|nr:alpha/beta hydrolase fold family protein [Aureobasidium subglaciale]